MSGDLKQKLAEAFPQVAHQLVFFEKGCPHPAYNELDCCETLKRFCQDLLPRSPFIDPRGKAVKVVKGNFPKLVSLKHKVHTREQFTAAEIVKCIENGTFELQHYEAMETARMRTIFWLPDVILDPDAIYKNGHKIIAGNEVYVKVYDKMGSKVKLVFTMDIENDGKLIRTVPVTSFLTDPEMVINFISGQPRYMKPKRNSHPEVAVRSV